MMEDKAGPESPGLEVIKLVHSQTQNKAQCLAACGHVIIALYFESENLLKFYNLEARTTFSILASSIYFYSRKL